MCRYAMTAYKPHYACFECRKTFKRRLLNDVDRDEETSVAAKCPECGNLMADMGLDFKSPPKDDLKAWQHLRTLYQVGITFHSCGCGGPGYVPLDKDELRTLFTLRKSAFVKNLSFWLNKSTLTTKRELALGLERNYVQYGYVAALRGRKGGVNVKEAAAYWNARIQELDQLLAFLAAGE